MSQKLADLTGTEEPFIEPHNIEPEASWKHYYVARAEVLRCDSLECAYILGTSTIPLWKDI